MFFWIASQFCRVLDSMETSVSLSYFLGYDIGSVNWNMSVLLKSSWTLYIPVLQYTGRKYPVVNGLHEDWS